MIRYSTFPRTVAPADFIEKVVAVFRSHEEEISNEQLTKGLTSDKVLEVLHEELSKIGFDLESGKKKSSENPSSRVLWREWRPKSPL